MRLPALFAAVLLTTSAHAATFTITSLPNGAAAVRMNDEISPGDPSSFERVTQAFHPTAIILSGPGGDLAASLAIGSAVHRAGMLTIVPPHSSCASGCGLVWLAGAKRYVASDARVGFHEIKNQDETSATHVQPAAAIEGAYMARLGISDAAIGYMIDQPSTAMAWLDWDKARELGVNISPFSDLTGYPQASQAQ